MSQSLGNGLEGRDITIQFWKAVKEIGGHGPGAQVHFTGIEFSTNAQFACFGVAVVTIPEIERPSDAEIVCEVIPKDVRAVMMLSEDEALAKAWPGAWLTYGFPSKVHILLTTRRN